MSFSNVLVVNLTPVLPHFRTFDHNHNSQKLKDCEDLYFLHRRNFKEFLTQPFQRLNFIHFNEWTRCVWSINSDWELSYYISIKWIRNEQIFLVVELTVRVCLPQFERFLSCTSERFPMLWWKHFCYLSVLFCCAWHAWTYNGNIYSEFSTSLH